MFSERVFEHVFHAPHVHIRQKRDGTGLWTIFSFGSSPCYSVFGNI